MIAKFQTELKERIGKSTGEFLFGVRWVVLVVVEYVRVKTVKLKF
jgi:hypothetical protein